MALGLGGGGEATTQWNSMIELVLTLERHWIPSLAPVEKGGEWGQVGTQQGHGGNGLHLP